MIKHLSIRDPQTFDMLHFIESSYRSILRRRDNEMFVEYIPEMMTHQAFLDVLSIIGPINRIETYIDPSTLKTITRGCVIKDDKDYFFFIEQHSDGYYESDVNNVLTALSYSGRETRKK